MSISFRNYRFKSGNRQLTPLNFCLAIFVSALTYRAYFLYKYWHYPDQHLLDFEDGDIARNLLAGHGYSAGPGWITPHLEPTAHKPPAYVGVIYLSLRLFGTSQIPLTVLNLLLMALATVLLYWLLRNRYDETIARVGALFFLLSPVDAFRHISITNTPLATVMLLGFLLVMDRATRIGDTLNSFVAGAVFGLSLLTLPPLVAFGLVPLWRLFRGNRLIEGGNGSIIEKRRSSLDLNSSYLRIGAFCMATTLLVAPWIFRNYRTFGELVPIGSSMPLEFAIGNGPDANGGLIHSDKRPIDAIRPELFREARERRLNEPQAYRLYAKDALKWSADNPERFLELRARSLFFFFIPQEMIYFSFGLREALFLLFTILLALGSLAGMVITWTSFRTTRDLVLGTLIFAGVYGLTHANVNARYREPIDPLLMGFMSVALVESVRWLRRKFSPGTLTEIAAGQGSNSAQAMDPPSHDTC